MKTPNVEVLKEHRWAGGVPKAIAIWRDNIHDVANRYGWHVERDVDGLGTIEQIYLRLPSGRVVVIRKHVEYVDAKPEVYADGEDDGPSAFDELISTLQLKRQDFEWIVASDTT